ncbi:MAG: LacI family DNA-binding transcriptional regulator [Anaerolineae bacterium]|jgi:DNA-binding LacI/PurR family transcriptional regulator|nr:LacI family DNA-binding transcriptional regulator [Anaerolineae bacterium]
MNKPNEKDVVTQQDVADYAGVSRAVVSYVLNNGPRKVSAETRQRVIAAIEELAYRPNKHAQRLKQGSAAVQNIIGIVTGGQSYNILNRPYYNLVLAGLFDSAHQLNQHIRFFSFFEALKDPVFFNKNIHPDEISSLILLLPKIITETPGHEEILDTMIERIDNIICLEDSIRGLPAVIFDRAAAAFMAVEHLIKLGHQQIAFLAIDDQRKQGYRQALLENNLPYDETLIRILSAVEPAQSAYQQTLEMLETGKTPTAIFTANDEAGIAAIAALHDRGLRVPDDVAITSIDDIELASMIRPALTTVNVPKRRMGMYAIQFLISQREILSPHAASMVLPIELIVRDSCGARR